MDDSARAYRTADFDYPLPSELIAQTPSPRRGDSRLLVVRRKDAKTQRGSAAERRKDAKPQSESEFQDQRFGDLIDLIPPGDLLVLNTTRVLPARLVGRRASGAPAEVLLIHPAGDGTWVAMGKPGRALRIGRQIDLGQGISLETLELLEEGYRRVRVLGATAEEAMERVGRVPLPPYIEREPTAEDAVRYQTVFAELPGSVAAPTAGLHLTEAMLEALGRRGVGIARLTLEVGPGTFKPVDEEDPARHSMHPEPFEISLEAAGLVADARRRGAGVWAVGTTVVRALESAAREDGTISPGRAETRLMIRPGYRFRIVDRLITNFHLPRSTLLMLVAGFAGFDLVMAAYRHAVRERYRFYSYGDAMLLQRER